jgi:hypothetical protein
MLSFRKLSIKQKLLAIIMLTVGVVLGLVCSTLLVFEFAEHLNQIKSDLETTAEMIGEGSTAALSFDDKNAAHELLQRLRAQPRVVTACIYSSDGKVFVKYARSGEPDLFIPPVLRPNADNFEQGHLVLFHRVRLDGQAIGTIYLESDLKDLYVGLTRSIVLLLPSYLSQDPLRILWRFASSASFPSRCWTWPALPRLSR